MKHQRRHRPSKPRVSPSVLERINLNAAGSDCGSAEHDVAVPPDRDSHPVESFTTFTSDLQRLADWLTACGVTSVAMEATGVYWIPLYEILDARGFEVLLVNARHVKNVAGRTSDVSDCEWLRELHRVGLLRGSFRPSDGIVALRAFGAFYRRLAARIGKPQAITATARKLALLVYRALKGELVSRDPGADAYDNQQRTRVLRRLRQHAATLGFELLNRETGEILPAGVS